MLSTQDSLWHPYKVGVLITSESRLVTYSWQTLYIQAILWAAALIRPDFRKIEFTLACPAITPSPSTMAFSHLCNLSSPCSVPRAASAHASTSIPCPIPSLIILVSFFYTSPQAPYTYLLPSFQFFSTTTEKKAWFSDLLMGLKSFGHVGWPAGRQNTAGNYLIHAETLPSFGVLI